MTLDRRDFLAALLAGAAAPALSADAPALHVSTNSYPWGTFAKRENRGWEHDLGASLAEVASTGIGGYEPNAASVDFVRRLAPHLAANKLEMRSIYVNSDLHDAAKAAASIDGVLAVADAAKALGTRIVVTNPSPIRWGGGESKTDAQLVTQAGALDRLGAALRERGMTLAYHNHDAEMRHSAREFHHMMGATDAKNVSLCLDAHWIYRGAGDSQVALFDIVKLYSDRIVELHLRQSQGGVWTEAFGTGDIEYGRLAVTLLALKARPLVVLEQAVEGKTPRTMNAAEAHRRSLAHARETFAAFAG